MCLIERFTIYTHVAIYIDWISNTVKDTTSTDVITVGNGVVEVEESNANLEDISMYCNYELFVNLDM